MTEVRKGQAPGQLERGEFGVRFRASFVDPAFRAEDEALGRLEAIAWDAYREGRKAPITRKAGPGYADPDYDLSVDWIETGAPRAGADGLGRSEDADARARDLRLAAQRRHLPGRDLEDVSPRRPGQRRAGRGEVEVDFLDLSLLTSEYGRKIHPVQGLRLDGDAALPLAVQLLPEPRARPDQRLDERDLRALGRGARDRHRHADALVPARRAR